MRYLFAVDEILAMMEAIDVPIKYQEQFKRQADTVARAKGVSTRTMEEISVTSSFGRNSQSGHVEFTLNDIRTQMDPDKARQVGMMLIDAASAAVNDAAVMALMKQANILDEGALRRILMDLREIRQGSRGTQWSGGH